MAVQIITGDCREVLATLPAESVHCVVTSPPYWGLRDYGVAGQIGLEAVWGTYVSSMVEVFDHVRRVLRSDGTLWLNLGDSYATGAGKIGSCPGGGEQGERWAGTSSKRPAMGKHGYLEDRISIGPNSQPNRMPQPGLKPKDLVGMPWRVALALQSAGWWLRQDIIWSKPNPMPESVTDRCTKAHEYVFLLSKSERYYFDAKAIAEPATYDPSDTKMPDGWDTGAGGHGSFHRSGREKGARSGNKERKSRHEADGNPNHPGNQAFGVPWEGTTRNKRSVWTVTTAPFSEAHFATFPPALIEPCILAGCPKGGTVLDPFGGAGTTGLVADRLQRDAILIEINPEYAAMAQRRIHGDSPLFADVGGA